MSYFKVKKYISDFNIFGKDLGFNKLYVVGGLCRDLVNYDGNIGYTSDVDLTCCDGPKSTILGLLISKEYSASLKYFKNKHCSMFVDGVKFDFSSGFIADGIASMTNNNRYKEDVLSRDFTLNSLLLDVEKDTLIDVTKNAVKDINNKMIRPVVSAEISLKDTPNRALRAIELATRLNFNIDSSIVDYIVKEKSIFKKQHEENIGNASSMITKCLKNDEEYALYWLKKTEILYQVPLTGKLKEVLIRRDMVDEYFEGTSSMINP